MGVDEAKMQQLPSSRQSALTLRTSMHANGICHLGCQLLVALDEPFKRVCRCPTTRWHTFQERSATSAHSFALTTPCTLVYIARAGSLQGAWSLTPHHILRYAVGESLWS
mmetsp:Transcript_49323/g.122561  ORF Transcript_49323/g.122561 Transcript_49323/m.122561 type:complete len:110 (-) Transcript_49323:377-706(-)